MLSLVPTPIGNISDISLRSLEILSTANTILCEDTRVTKKLIHLLKERHNLTTMEPQFFSLHSHNEAEFV
ncbi:MAG: rRNA (cytidine-2'-O-)-methyltransferase, partial [Sulfuricurvum sp.]|uniref:SAM-dependent methyltransferase n=1 Tax=Sulfuricurvum sp. TaxID=2025608 RepID=UPI0034368211|nr:rRNA (cytidine-2'-O-)-methyltransferase [Sulfuricurvum sp.]